MCGIVGIVHNDLDSPVSRDTVQRMCDAIRHRGPDDEGLFVKQGVGLGMRRLSIIDLAGGRQPISNEDATCTVVFNGEIYNYRDLRAGLCARGHALRSHSDTETIVHLYEELGAECVSPLRGMFAFAIWDARQRRLLLARDRFGIKPLYVLRAPWGVAFASELKALTAAKLTQRELDWDALDTYFQLGYIPAPATPFRDVRKLEPGCTMEWRPGGEPVIRRYWDLPRTTDEAPPDLEQRLRDWLDDSVKAHLESDVPLAAFLSGGLDSSAVVSSMALTGPAPHAFTARYHGSGAQQADETQLATALATRYGAKLTIIDIHPKIEDVFEPIVRALDEPHADESALPTWFISEAVSRQYKVALAGTGGDELFAGYRRHLGLIVDDLLQRVPQPVRRGLSRLANLLPEPRDGSLTADRLKRFLRTENSTPPDRFLGYVTKLPDSDRSALYRPELRAHISGGVARRHFNDLYELGGSPRALRAGLYLDYKAYLPDDILALSDRLAMAHSLEVRVPFVDHPLVEHVFPLPDRLKVRGGRSKALLRRALRPRLPPAHFSAPKRGFVGPTASWLRHELRGMIEDELSEARMQGLGYFDPSTIARLCRDHFERRHNREGILWALLCFSVWHRLCATGPVSQV